LGVGVGCFFFGGGFFFFFLQMGNVGQVKGKRIAMQKDGTKGTKWH